MVAGREAVVDEGVNAGAGEVGAGAFMNCTWGWSWGSRLVELLLLRRCG
jgi:hypothetical protein